MSTRGVQSLLHRALVKLRAIAGDSQALPSPIRNQTSNTADANAATPENQVVGSALAELRAATTLLVRRLRLGGAPPEKALSQVKSVLRDAMSGTGWSHPAAIQSLLALVVSWSIDAYYVR